MQKCIIQLAVKGTIEADEPFVACQNVTIGNVKFIYFLLLLQSFTLLWLNPI